MKATEAMATILRRGFIGPRPGSNAFPLLELKTPGCKFLGEEIDTWIRQGLLRAEPVVGEVSFIKGGDAGPYGEIPDVALTHRYELTDAGYAALKPDER
jgi:hypothetical protein